MRTLVAGVDCSTQATKVVVVDADSGETLGFGRAEHSVEGSAGVRETDPEVWWQALLSALGQTNLAGEVAAISIAGQQHGLVCLDEAGKALRPAMLWNDTRARLRMRPYCSSTAIGGANAWASPGSASFRWLRSPPRSGRGCDAASLRSRCHDGDPPAARLHDAASERPRRHRSWRRLRARRGGRARPSRVLARSARAAADSGLTPGFYLESSSPMEQARS
jgi:hypothetical protein